MIKLCKKLSEEDGDTTTPYYARTTTKLHQLSENENLEF